MTISNEPGYYEPGAFGIRIENLCVMRYSNTPNNFSGRRFLEFETVTMVPIKTDLINVSQLDDSELAWINAYHQSVRDKVLPVIEKYFPESAQYLIDETRPLTR
jgi:Xaa-Pro aminopeptidase